MNGGCWSLDLMSKFDPEKSIDEYTRMDYYTLGKKHMLENDIGICQIMKWPVQEN